ncbi:TylF/MycF/NovP-related O-methyltransferase [Alkalinema sp. FACHB-956]|uniref:TylF/MycF/NovP-related O-methyltransferase n=1 Tax=Alkalinema sp. FACHB-956 TaxID=2692768 RepID=UPI0016893029|nr:TylF/MycF/NovP-related O-methyltransferase [Alkalinema sp. FACHB-956]MBD2327826.1 class I SAM-dependent methyltransferase [Alkalinema sp. FACHB-956]
MKQTIKQWIRNFGFEVTRYPAQKPALDNQQPPLHLIEQPPSEDLAPVLDASDRTSFPSDFDENSIAVIRSVQPYTMTSVERIFALMQAVEYVVRADIPGAVVECGVWQGGSMMAVAQTLQRWGDTDRDLYLFDTYEGMPQPTEADVDYSGNPAAAEFEAMKKTADSSDWCYASIEQVRQNLASTGYPAHRVNLIKGKVEDTIPAQAPDKIAILRLDTDWYESTHHELIHLFPRLVGGGVLIIDDYGHWQGSRRATDEYLAEHQVPLLLNRVDYTARIAVKPFTT